MEIERKWLISEFASAPMILNCVIFSRYLTCSDVEVRIRHVTSVSYHNTEDVMNYCPGMIQYPYKMTIKGPGKISRVEVERGITEEEYNDLSGIVSYDPIVKKYRIVRMGKYAVEMSQVDDAFLYAEVEFESEDEANNFVIPEELSRVIIKEVTDDPDYKMKNYWKRTRVNAMKDQSVNE